MERALTYPMDRVRHPAMEDFTTSKVNSKRTCDMAEVYLRLLRTIRGIAPSQKKSRSTSRSGAMENSSTKKRYTQ